MKRPITEAAPMVPVTLGLSLLTLATLLVPVAHADLKMTDLNEPLPVELLSAIEGPETDLSTPFQAKLVDDVDFDNVKLKEGTLFSGTYTKATKSTHVLNPGYVQFIVNQVTYPDGRVLTFDEDLEKQKVFHEKANTGRRAIETAWPFAAVNAAVTLPMEIMGIPGGAAAALGAKMALGVAREYARDDKPENRPHEHKVGMGMLTGTGVPGLMFILSKRPEPELKEGDALNLYLDPDNMEMVFLGSSKHSPLTTVPEKTDKSQPDAATPSEAPLAETES